MTIPPRMTLVLPLLLAACSKDPPASSTPPPAVSIPPAASATAATTAPKAAVMGLSVSKGKSTFLIDAPLEKIKGIAEDVKGSISLDTMDLAKSSGEVNFKLSTLKTNTFGDANKDNSQTDHARNWMQVGNDSKAEDRAKFEWATFKILSVEASPSKLSEAKEENGGRTIKGKVTGDFMLHGVTSKKTLGFTAVVKGPVEKPTGFSFKTDAPFDVSLKEHDIKPRDGVGSFLNGALEKIGKKIDDRVQVSLEVEAGS